MRTLLVLTLLYVFLIGVSLMESGIASLGGGFVDGLLDNVANPLSGLFAGMLVTLLVQSSSVSTAMIVGLVGSGAVGVEVAVPMVMGANIGTTITSTFAALGSIRRTEDFRRGFAAATVHDIYNVLSVVVLLPIEMATGVLARSAAWLTRLLRGSEVNELGTSPIKAVVDFPVDLITHVVEAIGGGNVVAAILFFGLGLACVFLALSQVTRHMRQMVAGSLERTMNRMSTGGGGVIGIIVGLVVTVIVQSSSITTSILVPMVAAGVMTIRTAYPITIGANVGTTLTALLASLAVVRPEGLTIALVHTLFNVAGIALFYPPIKWLREIPVLISLKIADLAVERKSLVAFYLVGLFLALPLLGLLLLP